MFDHGNRDHASQHAATAQLARPRPPKRKDFQAPHTDSGEGDGDPKPTDVILYSGLDGFTPEVDLDNVKCCPLKFVYNAVPQTEECPEDKLTRVYWNCAAPA